MTIDWIHFTPWLSLAGGILLGHSYWSMAVSWVLAVSWAGYWYRAWVISDGVLRFCWVWQLHLL